MCFGVGHGHLSMRPTLSSLALQHLPLSHFITLAADAAEGRGPSAFSLQPKAVPSSLASGKSLKGFQLQFPNLQNVDLHVKYVAQANFFQVLVTAD